jgi:hypothetical protein
MGAQPASIPVPKIIAPHARTLLILEFLMTAAIARV